MRMQRAERRMEKQKSPETLWVSGLAVYSCRTKLPDRTPKIPRFGAKKAIPEAKRKYHHGSVGFV